jgi:DNA primase
LEGFKRPVMKTSDAFVEQLKSSVDIVHVVQGYVRLKKAGSSYLGLCPFHSEKTPSFHVRQNPAYFYCFGCQAKGDVFTFIQSIERITFPETLRFLAEKYGIAMPRGDDHEQFDQAAKERQLLLEIHQRATRIFESQLAGGGEGRQALAYLKERGLSEKTIEKFQIGYASGLSDNLIRRLGNDFSKEMLLKSGLIQASDFEGRYFDRFRKRIIFPIRNETGKVIAFGGRILGQGQPKYLNSPETPIYSKSRVLYALDQARDAIPRRKFAILVEGYMDCIALHQAGIENVIASCGTALTESQVKLLSRYSDRIVVNFDPDAAGSSATLRSLGVFLQHGFKIKVLALPEGNDPDTFVRKRGAAAYLEILEQALPYFDYLLKKARTEHDVRTVEGKVNAVNQVLPYLTLISNRFERLEQTKHVAEFFGVEETIIREELKKATNSKQSKLEIDRAHIKAKLTTSEKYLLKAILDNEQTAREVVGQLSVSEDYRGLQSENIFREVIAIFREEGKLDPGRLLDRLGNDQDRDFVNQALFSELGMDQAIRCLEGMRRQRAKLEIDQLQKEIRQAELSQDFELLASLHTRKTVLKRSMAS